MIKHTAQNWNIGATVKVGFLALIVVAAIPTPKDGRPDAYLLRRAAQMYTFTPHFGLEKISADEAELLIGTSRRAAASITSATIAKAQAADALIARFGA